MLLLLLLLRLLLRVGEGNLGLKGELDLVGDLSFGAESG